MKEILLTYIVPVYNTENYVIKCLQSIVNQGIAEDEYEVVVVDDGSPDNSKAVIQDFIATHHQVRLISQANAGLSAARNTGIDNARGRYLHFVDSDDFLVPGTMGPLLKRAVDENLDMLLFNFKNVDSDGNPISDRAVKHTTTPLMTGYDYLCNHAMIPYAWLFLLSRDHINKMGLRFDTSLRYCEDGPFSARILPNAKRVAYNDTVVYCYVNRENSIMHDTNIEHLRRRMNCQVDAAASINEAITAFEADCGVLAPKSVAGMRNVYLYFAMTKALTSGCVDEVLQRIRQAGLFPFPCVGPEANYYGKKWKVIHTLMMRPRLWAFLSKVYRLIKK
jgi:glycosyltransferase involved in cell wall biosynthesis